MWTLHYKLDHVSEPWSMLGQYDNKASALIKAYQVSGKYFMLKVTDEYGQVVWST